eukprot:3798994-Amphidinium_carterae.1
MIARSDRPSALSDRLVTLFRAMKRHHPAAVFSLVGQDCAAWKRDACQALIRAHELTLKFTHHPWCALTNKSYSRNPNQSH